MTTKQQEREALIKIRKIVEALGEDSYIGTAFKGVFNTAEQNIEWDAAFSLAEEAEVARVELVNANLANENLAAEVEKQRQRARDLDETLAKVTAQNEEYYATWRKHEHRAIQAEEEIIRLKAKLYDLMTAGT